MPQTVYVSEVGSILGDGTRNRPWPTVEFALGKTGGGSVVILLDGECQPFVVQWKYAGTEDVPTVIKAENAGMVYVRNAPIHGIYIASKADYVTIDGVTVETARNDGIKVAGNGCRIQRCTSTKNGRMGISAHGVFGLVIDDNVATDNGTGELYDHGIYVSGTGILMRNNTVYGNAAYGVHCYPVMRRSIVACNDIESDQRGGLLIYADGRFTGNCIAGNRIRGNATHIECMRTHSDTFAGNVLERTSSVSMIDCVGAVVNHADEVTDK